MANEVICLDSSILIDYFRKSKKENSFFFELSNRYSSFAVSVITEFEILSGSNQKQKDFWNQFFHQILVIPFDHKSNKEAIKIFHDLKRQRKLIDLPDLFIGATAKAHNLKLATLNEKDFSRISGLEILSKKKK
ncbi:type II toxin-antitoxin system VapC family toxin [Phaeodactylibacter xiamenensis]|uniref:Twitching motility protein PilT n=1 Tax=Phaeodactylibacter xiamenensis TaxID=1524460 RepID=A0A098S3S6_9BACT|nr:type II toxin-antitoxin system VapC family toxin [Phaeodactylibacter xiamenensis]KGE87019.1 twitching motility protein PilT [Phaeodactylibacter xiamenensis]MCR9050714.1 type II toxin-antitoxin system VapC family toxin [bacterium]